jgi:transcriptional regulator with XRE-family HTH domain
MVATPSRTGSPLRVAPTLANRLGSRIRVRREAISLTQAQLAEKSGVSSNYIGVVERGEKLPTLDTLENVAEALGVGLGGLLAEDQPDKWADRAVALVRAIPLAHRKIVMAMLLAAAERSRGEVRRRPRPRTRRGA